MTNEIGVQDQNPERHHRMDALKAKVAEIREDPKGKARELGENARLKGQELKEKLQHSKAAEWEQQAEHYMRENPGKSLGIAAAAGFVLGMIASGRKHH